MSYSRTVHRYSNIRMHTEINALFERWLTHLGFRYFPPPPLATRNLASVHFILNGAFKQIPALPILLATNWPKTLTVLAQSLAAKTMRRGVSLAIQCPQLSKPSATLLLRSITREFCYIRKKEHRSTLFLLGLPVLSMYINKTASLSSCRPLTAY